jgi:hypothetical protein
VERRDHHAGPLPPVISVITITGIGDHFQPVWLITFTGMRTKVQQVARLLTCDRQWQFGL